MLRKIMLCLVLLSVASGCAQKSGDETAIPPSYSSYPDIPIPSNASMNGGKDTVILGNGENWTGRLVYTMLNTRPAQMFDYYKNEMPRFNWTELSSSRSDVSFLAYKRGDRTANIQIESNLIFGSRISITMQQATK